MEPEELTLARKAYEAYCEKTGWKSLVTGDTLPGFYDLPEDIQHAWIAAGQAVRAMLEAWEEAMHQAWDEE